MASPGCRLMTRFQNLLWFITSYFLLIFRLVRSRTGGKKADENESNGKGDGINPEAEVLIQKDDQDDNKVSFVT